MGLMVVREGERWKAGVKGSEGLCWAEGEEGGHGEADALRPLLNCLGLAFLGQGGVVCGAVCGSQLAA